MTICAHFATDGGCEINHIPAGGCNSRCACFNAGEHLKALAPWEQQIRAALWQEKTAGAEDE